MAAKRRQKSCVDERNDSTVRPINNCREIVEENIAVTNDSNDKDEVN